MADVMAVQSLGATTIADVRFAQAWNVRGGGARPEFATAVQRCSGMSPPMQPNRATSTGEGAMLWLGPQSWLWLAQTANLAFGSVRDTLNAARGALFDVSASYVMWRVSGPNAARMLNRMCPLDLHDSVFAPGMCAQSLLGHVNTIVYRPASARALLVMVARSYAEDAWHHLCASAATEGYITGDAMTLAEAQA